MPFWKCYYHIVWTTKYRQPYITRAREQLIFATIHQVSDDLKSKLWAVNGTADHVHVAVSIPPGVAVAQWVKRCKGLSSNIVNKHDPDDDIFRWQEGYAVLTFGEKVLPFVLAYIGNQKQHHAQGHTEAYLEHVE